MLLTITTTHQPASDLGYLLAKHPDRCQTFELNYGKAHVFYPECSDATCTAALLLDIDPVGLVRGRRQANKLQGTLAQYVNDRPYVASSFFSVAIAKTFASALRGDCKNRPELAATPIPLRATISVLPCRGGEGFLRRLFEPLGYAVEATGEALDEKFPEWGESAYFTVSLSRTCTLSELLRHLYVLLPVLDNNKHYWVTEDEIDNLIRKGEGWLPEHPEKEFIAQRYLKHQRRLTRKALERLAEDDELEADDQEPEVGEEVVDGVVTNEESAVEKPLSLNAERLKAVAEELRDSGATRVIDLGCGEGKLVKALLKTKQFKRIAGVDVGMRSLEIAKERLHWDQMSDRARQRISLFQGSLTYRDSRFADYDAAALVEVIEHVDPSRLRSLERVVFEFAAPSTVVVTTPNIEYNAKYEGLAAGKLRHRDHRFEWTRQEFQDWAARVAEDHGYTVDFKTIGPVDPDLGSPTQMGVFSR